MQARILLMPIISIAAITLLVSADSGVPQSEETQGIATITSMQVIGAATEQDGIVIHMDDGYHAYNPVAPPMAHTSTIYTSSYLDSTIADQGRTSYTKTIRFDTRGAEAENQYNLVTDRIISFIGAESGRMSSEESTLLDGAGAGQYAEATMICPFASIDGEGIIPPFCNIVEQGSNVNIREGMLSTGMKERFIMQVTADDDLNWPRPVSDPGTEMQYHINLAGIGRSPAIGSASAFMNTHIMEGNAPPIWQRWQWSYLLAEDIVYNEFTTARGAIDLFQKGSVHIKL